MIWMITLFFFLNRWIRPVVKNTNLCLPEAFIGDSGAGTAAGAEFGILFTQTINLKKASGK